MKPIFDISLPSIPGKSIKFKIQDIKNKAFGSKKSRFNENKNSLTKKFVQSFSNFHQKNQQQKQTQPSQSSRVISQRSIIIHPDKKDNFRFIIPQQKKHMIQICENYHKLQSLSIPNQYKFNKGYTFSKTQKSYINHQNQSNQDYQQDIHNNNNTNNLNFKYNMLKDQTNNKVTENYYFTQSKLNNTSKDNEKIKNKQKHIKQIIMKKRQNAIFKAQSRDKIYTKIYDNQVPGPGAYNVKGEIQLVRQQAMKKRVISLHQQSKQNINSHLQYKKLKNIISEIVKQPEAHVKQGKQQNEEQIQQNKMKSHQNRPQYMFAQDDRDRFGKQRFPISFRLNVPGPGAYQVKENIQEQVRKVALIQEQRKLLKEWFNN